jgi:hypothetical protein
VHIKCAVRSSNFFCLFNQRTFLVFFFVDCWTLRACVHNLGLAALRANSFWALFYTCWFSTVDCVFCHWLSAAEAARIPANPKPPSMREEAPVIPQPASAWKKGITSDEAVRKLLPTRVKRKSAVEEVDIYRCNRL